MMEAHLRTHRRTFLGAGLAALAFAGAGRPALAAADAAAAASAAGAAPRTRRILVYGDSNTYGWVANPDRTVARLPVEATWPKRMEALLGEGWTVEVDALGGRTVNLDERTGTSGSGRIEGTAFNGRRGFEGVLSAHAPLDLVIIMLGTNDLRAAHGRSAYDIALGLGDLVSVVKKAAWQSKTEFAAPEVLVVSPPKLDDNRTTYGAVFEGALPKSEAFARTIEPVVREGGAHFLDAAAVVPFAGQADGIHLTREEHAALGHAAAEAVLRILPRETNRP